MGRLGNGYSVIDCSGHVVERRRIHVVYQWTRAAGASTYPTGRGSDSRRPVGNRFHPEVVVWIARDRSDSDHGELCINHPMDDATLVRMMTVGWRGVSLMDALPTKLLFEMYNTSASSLVKREIFC